MAHLTQVINDEELKATQRTFDWLSQQVKARGESLPTLKLVQPAVVSDSKPRPGKYTSL